MAVAEQPHGGQVAVQDRHLPVAVVHTHDAGPDSSATLARARRVTRPAATHPAVAAAVGVGLVVVDRAHAQQVADAGQLSG